MHHILLIPGFFGFANFGEIKYFAHVREELSKAYQERGRSLKVHEVATLPTASLPQRAAAIAATMAAIDDLGEAIVHLIGHSTGGLDARLFCSPGVSLPSSQLVEPLATRVRSVVTVATPHHGTPLASLFASLSGQRLLRVLSLLTLHGLRLGTMPLPALVAVTGFLPRLGKGQGPLLGILDQVYRQLLRDFDDTRRQEIDDFFSAATNDQNLIPQLGIESMQVFNAATTMREGTRYGCVVTQARPPSIRGNLAVGVSPAGQAIYALYRALYELAAGTPESQGGLSPSESIGLLAAYGQLPSLAANDAIVPTRSQLWGQLIHATWGDHLDVIGHFSGPDNNPPHVDWLATQSKFSHAAFEKLWQDVATFTLSSEQR